MPALINNRQIVMDDKHEMTSTDRPHRRVGDLKPRGAENSASRMSVVSAPIGLLAYTSGWIFVRGIRSCHWNCRFA
jgi:hypothetical protein